MPTSARNLELATLRCDQNGRVLTVRVDAPPFNYMTAAMQDDFARLVAAVETDAGVGAVVVTGGMPDRYITHFDIGDLSAGAEAAPAVPRPVASVLVRTVKAISGVAGEPGRRLLERTPARSLARMARFHETVEAILRSPAVWIAAVDGPCGGGGLELSVFFDVRLAAPSAHFLLPEVSIGLATTYGGHRLAQLVGPSRALEMMLEARAYTAEEAKALGVVNHVVDSEELIAHAQAVAARYARRPRAVVAAQKRIFNDTVPLRESLMREAIAQAVGIPSRTTRAALRHWLLQQRPSGDSTFLTDPTPWSEGTAVEMNRDR
jgi:enoyl-CoA hydratase